MSPTISACIVFCLLAIALASNPAYPQPAGSEQARAQLVERGCRGQEITSGPEHDELVQIEKRIAPVINPDQSHLIYVALAQNSEINAWAIPLDMAHSLVCVPIAMVHFMGDAEGELAFIVSHELGHAVDDQCKTQQGRLAVAESRGSIGALLGGILGGTHGAYQASQLAQQKGCEARADEIGFAIFTKAGYNPFDAAGSFGRLEMYLGDTQTGVLARLNAISSDHPMTPDRINHMRELLIRAMASRNQG
jgi:predicted Zn-dependent protease